MKHFCNGMYVMTRQEHIEQKIQEAMGLILLERHEFGDDTGNYGKAWGLLDSAIVEVRDAYND